MSKEASKTQQLAEAARLRTKVEREAAEENVIVNEKGNPEVSKYSEQELAAKKDAAEENIAIRPQAVAGSLTGEIDPEAMGDVKGDGGDAKDYPDNDPDKALGVPTYEHGLAEDRVGGTNLERGKDKVFGHRQSAKTQQEMERGKKAIAGARNTRAETTKSRTVVTDADEDPNGDKGLSDAEKKAKAAREEAAKSKSKGS